LLLLLLLLLKELVELPHNWEEDCWFALEDEAEWLVVVVVEDFLRNLRNIVWLKLAC
jgi:hypothetical protein